MISVIYEITDTITMLKYIGSKRDWKGAGTYFGTLCSKHKKLNEQTAWKLAAAERPETFKFDILYSKCYSEISTIELVEIEGLLHRLFNVVQSNEYVNAAYANKGYCGRDKGEYQHSKTSCLKISDSLQNRSEESKKHTRNLQSNAKKGKNLQ